MSCRARELAAHRALPGRAGRRGKFLEMSWLVFPASSSCRGLVLQVAFPASSSCRGLVWPSRQAPLAGALRLGLSILFLNGSKGTAEDLGGRLASLAAVCCDCPCTS